MLPNQALSDRPVPGAYLDPDNRPFNPLIDYEMGGTALNDPGDGFLVQVWTLSYNDPDVLIEAPSVAQTVLFEQTGITSLSLAFDQSMRPFVAFVADGQAQYWWFDPQSGGNTITALPDGTEAPRCCLDDKREEEIPNSDIIMAYVRDGTLYFRAERDRYTVEYTLTTSVPGTLRRIGMNNSLRVQFEFGGPQ